MTDFRLIELNLVKDELTLTERSYPYKGASQLAWSVQLPPKDFYASIAYYANLCNQAEATKVLQRHIGAEAKETINEIIGLGAKLKNLQRR